MTRTTRATSRSLIAVLAALALLASACGGDDDDETSTDEGTETTAAAEETTTTEAETTTTEAEAEETTTTAEAEEEEAMEDPEGLPIELGEWFISEPTGLETGTTTFSLTNVGENPHALAIARGTAYEDLPQKDNGAVDTEMLGDDFLGTSENVASGESGSIEFDLEAGDYVFFCPIEFGPNSHAAAGQVLSVTVG